MVPTIKRRIKGDDQDSGLANEVSRGGLTHSQAPRLRIGVPTLDVD